MHWIPPPEHLLTPLGLGVERLELYQFPDGAGLQVLCGSIHRLSSFGRCPVGPDAWRLCSYNIPRASSGNALEL